MDYVDWQDGWDDEDNLFQTKSEYNDDTTLEGALNYHLYVISSPSRSNQDPGSDSIDMVRANPQQTRSDGPLSGQRSNLGVSQTEPTSVELGKRIPGGRIDEKAYTLNSQTQLGQSPSGGTVVTVKPAKKNKPTELQADIDIEDVDFGNVKFLTGEQLIEFYRTHKVYSAYPELLDPTLTDKDRKKLGHDIRKRISAQECSFILQDSKLIYLRISATKRNPRWRRWKRN